MVQMKLDSTGVDPNKSNGFEPYEGPLPKPGVYAAEIKSMKVRISQAGNPYFNVLFEFRNQNTPEKQKVKGYPLFEKITPGESDFQKERVGKLIHAICGRLKANVDHEEVTDGGTVKKVGGKDPIGTRCRVVVRRSSFNGEPTVELSDLFAWPKDEEWPTGDVAEDDDDVEVEEEEEDEVDDEEIEEDDSEEEEEDEEDEEEEEDDDEFAARQAELADLDRTALKAVCKEHGLKVLKSNSDDDLREKILDVEFPPAEGDDEEDDEPPF